MRAVYTFLTLLLLFQAPAALARTAYNCLNPATSGAFLLTDDCTLSGEVILTGDLDILGVPKPDGSYPVITAAASNRHRHFKINYGAHTLRLKWLKMTGVNNLRSGGIYVRGSDVAAHVNVSHCVFFNNHNTYGGAVEADDQSNLFFSYVLFDSNIANIFGGAVFLSDGASFIGFRNIYTGNTADWGGALSVYSASPMVLVSSYSHFKKNTATYRGGGIFVRGSKSTQLNLTRVVLEENKQTDEGTSGFDGGGGLFLRGKVTGNIRECTFIRNEAIQGSNGGKHGHQIMTWISSVGTPSVAIVNTNFTDLPGSHPFYGVDATADGTHGADKYVSPTTCSASPCTIEPFTGACATHPFGASNGVLCDYDSSITCLSGLYYKNKIINSTSLLPPSESACGCSAFTPLGGVCTAFTDTSGCNAERKKVIEGTASTDARCGDSCATTQYASGTQCIDYITTCPDHEYLSAGSATADKDCIPCAADEKSYGGMPCKKVVGCLTTTEQGHKNIDVGYENGDYAVSMS